MTIVRYNTLNALPARNLQEEFKQVFERFFGDVAGDQSDVVTSQWAPRVDIKEEHDRFVIFADIPGVDPKDIEVQMDRGMLTLKGERASEQEDGNERYTRRERAWGSFYRRFALPDSADPDGITATGRNGVLRIDIPKRPETTPRRIEVN
ncbi:Hsp20/alpha crystallin family protein [Pseudoxanthomonas sp. SGNA-20]|jgi:Molecular chaperone (small heat shock protein)|uniref:HSP20 family protein n=1 Tax=Pseudoxanthomonas taiwanensis J19 TaxID=935569 RepID=A0A562E3Y9_9GAMM|nr:MULTISPECIES: Hsp20/alpha crystallin family protein [Pseudoxanthomonas]RRN57290.1 Hsp20/alpha crystallin family protein [Pseudoxanthomonas sp. SGNA-20]RRN80124.1 Hsp20/alpha crystallin family protein [Pseudoxanthomonas sp. SGD-10]TWH16388.1 HSP20 family protein [Pseudoxanthomonas taiwanensis J19]